MIAADAFGSIAQVVRRPSARSVQSHLGQYGRCDGTARRMDLRRHLKMVALGQKAGRDRVLRIGQHSGERLALPLKFFEFTSAPGHRHVPGQPVEVAVRRISLDRRIVEEQIFVPGAQFYRRQVVGPADDRQAVDDVRWATVPGPIRQAKQCSQLPVIWMNCWIRATRVSGASS